MDGVKCNTFTPPRLIKPVSVHLRDCNLPDDFVEKILRQLFGCGESLQHLGLFNMDLKPFESLIDELLEDLVAHHEAGLVQRKLRLLLLGIKDDSTDLSSRFMEKWRKRCEKVDSIDCYITK